MAPFEKAPRPKLVLLDINMPGMSGCELLREIKGDRTIADIPVIILSSSTLNDTIRACYRDHANAYLEKPADLLTSLDMVASIESFWFGCAISCP